MNSRKDTGNNVDLQSKYDFNSDWADRIALLIVIGLAVEIVAVFVFKKPFWEGATTILANVLIVAGVWGELYFAKRAKEAADQIVAAAHERAAKAVEAAHFAYQEAKRNAEPRKLDLEKFKEFVERSPPAKAEVLYVRECADCLWLAFSIRAMLMSAKWDIVKYEPIEEPTGDKVHLPAAMVAGGTIHGGVTIIGKPPLDWVAFDKPFAALHAALVCGGLNGSPAVNGMSDDSLPEELIRIVVAPRP